MRLPAAPRAAVLALALVAGLGALAGCDAPEAARTAAGPDDAPPPQLVATDRFFESRAKGLRDVARLEDESAALAARAALLRARAAALDAPVIDDAARDRLEAGAQ